MRKQKFARTAPPDFDFYQWRLARGYTQVEAARILGVGHRTVTYYERGRDISWPVYLACLYVKQHKRAAERMAKENDLTDE